MRENDGQGCILNPFERVAVEFLSDMKMQEQSGRFENLSGRRFVS